MRHVAEKRPGRARRPPPQGRIATYSIVAHDAAAREWGVGVESKFLAVGSAVPWARAEVGAVATQALANLGYGPRGLEFLAGGLDAAATVERLTADDPGRDDRQLGVVDREGRAATFTGAACLPWAGGVAGAGFAAQGNILESGDTVDALVATFAAGAGSPLAPRLIACLRAAQAAGGDRRGQQSAALLVVREGGGYGGGNDRLVDLRVDDHPTPVEELARLYDLHRRLFGSTPAEEWLPVGDALRAEIGERLARLGYREPALEDAFRAWAGTENLEERVDGLARIDPVVLAALRGS
jgi:uncharacterized Ntn-hydrolase superfamily protein